MNRETIEADILCVGGGIAGLMAAIRASELGAKVIVAEKANSVRSGSGGVGNDHFACYIPEIHGSDFKAFIDEVRLGQLGPALRNPEVARTWFENTYDIIKMWEEYEPQELFVEAILAVGLVASSLLLMATTEIELEFKGIIIKKGRATPEQIKAIAEPMFNAIARIAVG